VKFILKTIFTAIMAVISFGCFAGAENLIPGPVSGSDWRLPEIDMEFVWIKALDCWVGKYEVTNGEYRKLNQEHYSKDYRGNSLSAERQPAVYVPFSSAIDYAKWITERERTAGRLPAGYCYRLPTEKEWTTFCQCGDEREYPWGNGMPPKYGNYYGQEANGVTGKTIPVIPGFNDGFIVTCPVEKSGKNEWGLYGVGGNAWECTIRSSSDFSFDAWRGAAWCDFYPSALRSMSRLDYIAPYRAYNGGFRLVLTR
jgi:formylglycine-generating enzyme required for sulfatase activity